MRAATHSERADIKLNQLSADFRFHIYVFGIPPYRIPRGVEKGICDVCYPIISLIRTIPIHPSLLLLRNMRVSLLSITHEQHIDRYGELIV